MHYFLLIYFTNHPLHVSNRLNFHHQEVFYCICTICYSTLIMLAASQRICMINTLCCIYSKIPPDDESLGAGIFFHILVHPVFKM
jgi:hypothetical protein